MKIICGTRSSGKSTELIKIAADQWLYIVCLNRPEVLRIQEQARQLGLDIPFPLTFDEFIGGSFSQFGIKGFVVDNVDMLVQKMAGRVPVRAVSLTDGDAN